MHRYVRHPLYLGAYLYLLAGTWFEERSLVAQYGHVYVEYKEKVPSIFPLKGRAIK